MNAHGTVQSYWAGCHCDDCRAAVAEYGRARRASRVEELGGAPASTSARRWSLTDKGLTAAGGAARRPPVPADALGIRLVPVLNRAGLRRIAAANAQGAADHPRRAAMTTVGALAAEAVAETFVRPNGKPYQPQSDKLKARAWENPDDDWAEGCVITGTLDPERAHDFAVRICSYWYGATEVVEPRPAWWRIAMRDGGQQWVEDAERGQPGVMFTAVAR